MKRTKTLTLILMIMAFAVSAQCIDYQRMPSPDYYVDPATGRDDYLAGSKESPWRTLTYALSQAQPCEDCEKVNIHLAPGFYGYANGEKFPIQMRSDFTISGADRDRTIIDAFGDLFMFDYRPDFEGHYGQTRPVISAYFVQNVILENLTIQHGEKGIISSNSSLVVKNCAIRDNWHDTTYFPSAPPLHTGAVMLMDSSCTFRNTIISGNKPGFSESWFPSFVILCVNSSPSFINCLITGNTASQGMDYEMLDFVESIPSGFIVTAGDSSPTFISNTIAGNQIYCPNLIDASLSSRALTMVNSIIWGNRGDNRNQILGDLDITYSDLEWISDGMGNISAPPLFVMGPLGKYYLKQVAAGQDADSPCINKGAEVPAFYYGYNNGTTRNDGVLDLIAIDMGYHYTPHVQFVMDVEIINPMMVDPKYINARYDIKIAPVLTPTTMDIYLNLYMETAENWSFIKTWQIHYQDVFKGQIVYPNLMLENVPVLGINTGSKDSIINMNGRYKFEIYATKVNSTGRISNISSFIFPVIFPD